MQHKPRKQFGQNFLEDFHVIQQIITAIAPQPHDNMIEIGPGLGALTRPLLKHLNQLTVIEIDTALHAGLASLSPEQLTLIPQDVLTVDFSTLGTALRVIGNLPYNISTPLLFHLLEHLSYIKDMHFMLQKEVVQRLSATPGSKAYGRLSVITQAQCMIEPLFLVPPEAFYPAPKVDSAMVRLIPHPIQHPKAALSALEDVLLCAFKTRRKTIANTLKPLFSLEELAQLQINPSLRPENLSVNEYINIAKYLTRL